MTKKLDAKELIEKIERLARERMAEGQVVDLGALRDLRKQKAKPNILVVEDDETMRNALKRILETEGFDVRVASDGTQLGQTLGDKPVDLILLDVGLPWVNGFELAKMLKEHPLFDDVPLVFISGRVTDDDVKQGFDAGCDDYIKKPFEIEKVRRTVRTLLRLGQE